MGLRMPLPQLPLRSHRATPSEAKVAIWAVERVKIAEAKRKLAKVTPLAMNNVIYSTRAHRI